MLDSSRNDSAGHAVGQKLGNCSTAARTWIPGAFWGYFSGRRPPISAKLGRYSLLVDFNQVGLDRPELGQNSPGLAQLGQMFPNLVAVATQ